MRAIAIILPAAILATPAMAAPDEYAQDPNAVICKSKPQTESRFQRKTCMTRAQWETLSEEHKRMWAEIRDRPIIEIRK